MQTKRDNLVLIGAFAAAIALHAVMLPWVGAAVGDAEQKPQVDLVVSELTAPSFIEVDKNFFVDVSVREATDNIELFISALYRVDGIWLSRDRVISDDDYSLGTIQKLSAGNSDYFDYESLTKSGLKVAVPVEADGPYWLIYQADIEEAVPEADRSNNTRVAPIYIDGPQRPELAVQAFNAPDRAVAGGSVLIDFAIQNLGDGWASSNPKLGEHGWADRIYLSTDNKLDPTDLPLRTFERTAPLGPNGEYRHESVELELPRGVAGPMHLILAAEVAGLPRPTLYVGSWSDWSSSDLPVATGSQPG